MVPAIRALGLHVLRGVASRMRAAWGRWCALPLPCTSGCRLQLIPPLFGLLFWLLVLVAFNHVVSGVRLVLIGFILLRAFRFLSLYWPRHSESAGAVLAEPLSETSS